MKLTPEQEDWAKRQAEKHGYQFRFNIKTVKTLDGLKPNPCIAVFGAGPEGKRCKNCSQLYRIHKGKTYLKCALRIETNGPGSDHKANWPACGKFEASVSSPSP